jgi:hypothetical protein
MHACEHLKEKITLHIYGELDPVSRREIEDHLKICESCRQEHKRLSSILTQVRQTRVTPALSPKDARVMVADIRRELANNPGLPWWRKYLDFMPPRFIPAAALAVVMIITVAVIGYVNRSKTEGLPPVSLKQNKELLLSDTDLEILDNLELLKEMDSIQKLSRVVDPDGETEFQPDMDNDTRGMKQDAYRHYLV